MLRETYTLLFSFVWGPEPSLVRRKFCDSYVLLGQFPRPSPVNSSSLPHHDWQRRLTPKTKTQTSRRFDVHDDIVTSNLLQMSMLTSSERVLVLVWCLMLQCLGNCSSKPTSILTYSCSLHNTLQNWRLQSPFWGFLGCAAHWKISYPQAHRPINWDDIFLSWASGNVDKLICLP